MTSGTNQNLLELLLRYVRDDSFAEYCDGLSKPTLVSILADLVTMYANDKNSSTVRELVATVIAGFKPNTEKLGYNGFRANLATGETEYCEVKPQNIDPSATTKKLNGGGSFNDFRWARFEKMVAEPPTIISAGFVDGFLLYVMSFSFREGSTFAERLREQLVKRLPDGDRTQQYLRAASFTFKHYQDQTDLQVLYTAPKAILEANRAHITGPLYKYLRGFAD